MARTITIDDGKNVHQFLLGVTNTLSAPSMAVEFKLGTSRLFPGIVQSSSTPTFVVESGQKVICHTAEQPPFAISMKKYEERPSQNKMTRLISRFRRKGNGYEPVTSPQLKSSAQTSSSQIQGSLKKIYRPDTIMVVNSKLIDCQTTAAALALLDLNKSEGKKSDHANVRPSCTSPEPKIQTVPESEDEDPDEVRIIAVIPPTTGGKDRKAKVARNTTKPYSKPKLTPKIEEKTKIVRNKGIKTLINELDRPYNPRHHHSWELLKPSEPIVLGDQDRQYLDLVRFGKELAIDQDSDAKRSSVSVTESKGVELHLTQEGNKVGDVTGSVKINTETPVESTSTSGNPQENTSEASTSQITSTSTSSVLVATDPHQVASDSSPHYRAIRALFRLYHSKGKICKRIREKWYMTTAEGKIHQPSLDDHFDKTRHTLRYAHLELLENARNSIYGTKEVVDLFRTRLSKMPEGNCKKVNQWLLQAADQEIGTCLIMYRNAQGPLGKDRLINDLRHIMVKMLAMRNLVKGNLIPTQLTRYTMDLVAHQNKLAATQLGQIETATPCKEDASVSTTQP